MRCCERQDQRQGCSSYRVAASLSGHIYKLKSNYIRQFRNNYRKQTEPTYLPVFRHWRAFIALTKLLYCSLQAAEPLQKGRRAVGPWCSRHPTLTHVDALSGSSPMGAPEETRTLLRRGTRAGISPACSEQPR